MKKSNPIKPARGSEYYDWEEVIFSTVIVLFVLVFAGLGVFGVIMAIITAPLVVIPIAIVLGTPLFLKYTKPGHKIMDRIDF